MRVNARLDEQAQQQIEYLTQATGMSVSQVVRESVAHYYAHVQAKQVLPRRLLAMIGKGHSGSGDVASNVKRELDDILAARLGKSGD